MKVEVCLIFCALIMVYGDMLGECDMAAFYHELRCVPAPKADNSSACPDTFNCPDLTPDPEKCYYRGKSFDDREMIPQNLVKNPCSQVCICVVSSGTFQCAAVDCVETFNTDMEQCIYTYDVDSCCYTGTVCGKDDLAKLKICQVDGQTYKEGQQFNPKNTRKTCICTAQWNGTLDDPTTCRDIDCGIEIHYQDYIKKKCAPVFLSSDLRGCPISFQCPSNSSALIRGLNRRTINSKCTFGNMTLGVGDEVTVEDKCIKCTCEVPPFVTCSQGPVCKD